jgi:hypothetical protein
MVIGHESSGIVAAIGPGVKGVAVGDRVALEPGAPCWHCKAAREGRCVSLTCHMHCHLWLLKCRCSTLGVAVLRMLWVHWCDNTLEWRS